MNRYCSSFKPFEQGSRQPGEPGNASPEDEKRLLMIEETLRIISSRLLGMGDADEAIYTSLADIGRVVGADRVCIFLYSKDGEKMDVAWEWDAEGVPLKMKNIRGLPCNMFPCWMNALYHEEEFCIADVSDIPEKAQTEKKVLEAQGIQSILAFPLYTGGVPSGSLGVEKVGERYNWQSEDKRFLLTASQIIGEGLARIKWEENLMDRDQDFRLLFQNMVNGFAHHEIILDDKGVPVDYVFLEVNEAFEHLTGLKRGEVLGRRVTEVLPGIEHEPAGWITRFGKVALSGEALQFETYSEVLDQWYSVNALCPRKYQFIVIFENVTPRKESIERMKKSEQELSAIYEHAPLIMTLVDENVRIRKINDFGVQFSGKDQEDLIGFRYGEAFNCLNHLDDPRGCGLGPFCGECHVRNTVLDTLTTGKACQMKEATLPHFLDGKKKELTFLVSTSTLYLEGEQLVLVSLLNITERKQVEKEYQLLNNELTIAKEKAEESDRLKSAFLANMSHEVRTPMNGIMGFSQILQERELEPSKRNEFLSIISSRTKHLMQVINDLIDISKIEAGQLDLKYDYFDLNDLLYDLYEKKKKELYEQGNNQVRLSVKKQPAHGDCSIYGDQRRLSQVMEHLLDNATKFTPQGEVNFGYENADRGMLQIFVQDTGIGIDREKQQMIFDRFRRGDESLSREYEGTGLGLTISKKLIELMGGSMWVESEKGKGSAFYFTLPCQCKNFTGHLTSGEVIDDQTYHWKGKTILLVEDDPTSQEYLKEILVDTQVQLLVSGTGGDALKQFKQNRGIDLILMDIRLPDIHGLEVVGEIRKTNKQVRIITQTAHILGNDRDKCLQAGADDFIAKPIGMKDLLSIIGKYI